MTNSTAQFWDADGTSLQTLARNLKTWGGDREGVPDFRGEDTLVPYRAGRKWVPKVPDSRTIGLSGWVVGANDDGTIGDVETFRKNWKVLRRLLWTPGRQIALTRRWLDPDTGLLVTATAMAEYAGGLTPEMTGPNRADFQVDLHLADPFFYGEPVVVELTSTNRTNQCTNPSFETGTASWAALVSTLSNPLTGGWSGVRHLRCTATTATTAFGATGTTHTVVAGEAFAVSAYVRGTVGRGVQIRITWTGAAATSNVAVAVGSLTAWQRLTYTGVVPVGATAARVDLVVAATGVVIGDVLDVDGVLAERAATIGAYFDGDTPDTASLVYAWTGVAHASTSTEYPIVAHTVRGDYLTTKVVVRFVGPLTSGRITVSDLYPQVWVRYLDLAQGHTVDLDVDLFRAVHNSGTATTLTAGNVRHDGSPFWLPLVPGARTLVLTAEAGTGTARVTYKPAWL